MSQGLLYTYLDEVTGYPKTDKIYRRNGLLGTSFGITSITFPQKHYIEFFEKEWADLRLRYGIDINDCIHFTDYKRLLQTNNRSTDKSKAFTYFENTDGTFNKYKYINFLKDIKNLLERSSFFIVCTDVFRSKKTYKNKNGQILEKDVTYGKNILKTLPEITMTKHLNSLLKSLIWSNEGFLDETKLQKLSTKIRIDSDGKQFQYKVPFKVAYNRTLNQGSESFIADSCTHMLEELRFVRKEEVGSIHHPSHCGLELVDFLCSNVAGSSRIKYLNNKLNLNIDTNTFRFDVDGTIIDFQDVIEKKYRYIETFEDSYL